MRLTNPQKKELSDILEKTKLNNSDFETSGELSQFKIKFKYDFFSFNIENKDLNKYDAIIFPVNNTNSHTISGTWEQIKLRFSNWINQIDIDYNTPTGWENFQNNFFVNVKFEELDEKFSESEKIQIKLIMTEIKKKVESLDLPVDSIKAINKKLDALTEKVNGLSKFDWKSFFMGTIQNLITSLSIPPQMNGILGNYILKAFENS